ncbi:nitrite reductase, copper-containing [Candidatus Woesearchaeota archaeon]|nr:nitrite reductase, copper-containing [Candidatus Woesearchaeota archaeon]
MFGHLTTFGPGEAPHLHQYKLSSMTTVTDIARAAADVPLPLGRDFPATVKITLVSKEVISEIAPGITYVYWTFNETVPGPFLRVREGDVVELTLYNDPSSTHNHSIDLHAVTGPGGGAVLTQVEPGKSKTIRFKALNPGLYVYHCATPDVPMHVAHGMYGLILVEPKGGLPSVDREFYVMQGELYTTQPIGMKGLQVFDAQKMLDEQPEYVLFNGRVKALADKPLTANVGETVRVYMGNGGVARISSFHVIGEIFDTVYPEAATSALLHNVQSTIVPAGGATITDFRLEVPGSFVLVDHALARIDRGAWGILKVAGADNAEVFAGVGGSVAVGGGHGG